MKILAFDTSTEACTVALLNEEELTSRNKIEARGHANSILAMVKALLNEANITLAQLDVIAYGCGPGSFTGLRIAAGVCQGLAFGADLPVVSISSLCTVAQGVYRQTANKAIVVIQDARKHEVYWGCFVENHGVMVQHGSEYVSMPDKVILDKQYQWFGVGSGWTSYSTQLAILYETTRVENSISPLPVAEDMMVLAKKAYNENQCITADKVNPIYLRNTVAWKKSVSK